MYFSKGINAMWNAVSSMFWTRDTDYPSLRHMPPTYVLTQPLHLKQDVTRLILKRIKAGLNSEFSLTLTGCLTLTLPYYLPITGERTYR